VGTVAQHNPKKKKYYFVSGKQFESSLTGVPLISEVLRELHPASYSLTRLPLLMLIQNTDSEVADMLATHLES